MRVCRLTRFAVVVVAAVLALGYVAGRGMAKDEDPGNAAGGDAADANKDDFGASKKAPAKGAKDPVATAFALPKGVTLNAQQQAAYDQLKGDKEAELREALDAVQNSDSNTPSAQALKKLRECKAEIRKAIDAIVTGRGDAGSGKSGQGPQGSGSEGAGYAPYTTGYGGYGYGGYGYPGYGYGGYPYNPYGYYPRRPRWNNGTGKSSASGGSSTAAPASGTAASGKSSPPPKRSPPPPPPKKK